MSINETSLLPFIYKFICSQVQKTPTNKALASILKERICLKVVISEFYELCIAFKYNDRVQRNNRKEGYSIIKFLDHKVLCTLKEGLRGKKSTNIPYKIYLIVVSQMVQERGAQLKSHGVPNFLSNLKAKNVIAHAMEVLMKETSRKNLTLRTK